jgi:hypothetical protein
MVDFLGQVSLSPPAFNEEKLKLFLDAGDDDFVHRAGIFPPGPPIAFGNKVVGTDVHWKNNFDLFWTISAEHYLTWNTATSEQVRKLVCVGSVKE